MLTAKTPLLRMLQRAYQLSTLSAQSGLPPVDEIAEWSATKNALSRRQFLHRTALGGIALGAAPLLANFKWLAPPRIAIVGAGMAGLHTGYLLKKAGLADGITIYEGSKRTGGRMFTERLLPGGTTELGGEFVDSDHTEIRALAAEFGVTVLDRLSDKDLISDAYFLDNQHHTQQRAIAAFAKIRKKIAKDAKSIGENLDTPAAQKFDRMTMQTYIDQLETDEWFKKTLSVAYIGEFGLETNQQSALNFITLIGAQKRRTFEMFGTSDERYKLLGGNQQLCDRMADKLTNQIQLEHKLIAVKNKEKGFVLTFEHGGSTKEIEADYVVMTIPFTLLRHIKGIENLDGITPAKIQCIKELGYGMNGKYFFGMKERIWRKQQYQGYLYTEQIHSGWDSFHLQNKNEGESVYSVFLGGTAGAQIKSGNAAPYLDEINKAFPGTKAAHGTMKESSFNWNDYTWAKGSYVCYTPGQWLSIAGQESVPIGQMLFAGEHCSVEFQGFMNGAAETGRAAANQLMTMLQGRK